MANVVKVLHGGFLARLGELWYGIRGFTVAYNAGSCYETDQS
jgi:hypothetical protein